MPRLFKPLFFACLFIGFSQSLLAQGTYSFACTGCSIPKITRGPYLQTDGNRVLIRWFTDVPTISQIRYDERSDTLRQVFTNNNGGKTTYHYCWIPFERGKRYYYGIFTENGALQRGLGNTFFLPKTDDKSPIRVWAIGDCGYNTDVQKQVRDAYLNYLGKDKKTDAWLILGDNAYVSGYEEEYQSGFFNAYQEKISPNTFIFPSPGNHDYADGRDDLQNSGLISYFGIFDPPTEGTMGGVASKNKMYYSYNLGNTHFISLDSYGKEARQYRMYDTLSPQYQWLKKDLAANKQLFTVVYFHHPPFSLGSHSSDTDPDMAAIRLNLVKLFDQYSVDVVLCGHSHLYERSYFMKDFDGKSADFVSSKHALSTSSAMYDGSANSCPYIKKEKGTVYVVAGTASLPYPSVSEGYPHKAMQHNNIENGGSLILEIEQNRLDLKWLCEDGKIRDKFTLMKDLSLQKTAPIPYGGSVDLKASWLGTYVWQDGSKNAQFLAKNLEKSSSFVVKDTQNCLKDSIYVQVLPPLGTESLEQDISVYPNPNIDGILWIELNKTIESNEKINLEIIDTQGIIWHKEQKQGIRKWPVSMADFPKNQAFFVKITIQSKTYLRRFLYQ